MTAKPRYAALRARADAVRWSIWKRAQAACDAAGLTDAGILHNAIVGADVGRPWRGVDYAKAREARRLFDQQFRAQRWLSNLYRQRGPAAFDWS
jgi:hypothetical protein